ncbi:hypothetical protein BHY07_15585 [Bacillus subtilis subsp. subtilis]|uniref:Uncharacterized protein n=2 Tax=Bacillus subtilis subsp. subtilis TaxID=135461 RepID=A0A2K4Z9L8_BACSU|nr:MULTISPECIES: hypothetical protein [Bacillales]YP_009513996.1 hypothetical protein BSU_28709 [Bacillus subtilis subsp. subtilis str. 168]MDP4123770.1 hypothetical protein [Bacillota bacterium]BAM54119.1 hypothetical protein BEST7613_5188 [Bacillus subtilis BEST7613]AIY94199.1 hypothetical protein QU35_15605 [Bacillus subtilis subsp. subtilis str. 168]AIY98508.1 hypothetical protein QX56_15595 [Bacillus subtilis]AJE95579.1 hypothetical protein RP72_15485 [Bacillus subtilis subsp. subtilis]
MGADVERSELKDGSIYTGLEGLLKMLRGVGNESINEISYSIRIGQQAGYSFFTGIF